VRDASRRADFQGVGPADLVVRLGSKPLSLPKPTRNRPDLVGSQSPS
jgi:hypothetical protein